MTDEDDGTIDVSLSVDLSAPDDIFQTLAQVILQRERFTGSQSHSPTDD